jgi:formyl-CoA transferase
MNAPAAMGALGDIRVLDLSRVRSGPTCVKQLADFGADVIKIETPSGDGDGALREGPDFQNLHRNKRSLTLNLKAPAVLLILAELVNHLLIGHLRRYTEHKIL